MIKLHGWKKDKKDKNRNHYISPCGKFHCFNTLQGTSQEGWEVFEDDQLENHMYSGTSLTECILMYRQDFQHLPLRVVEE